VLKLEDVVAVVGFAEGERILAGNISSLIIVKDLLAREER